MRIHNLFGIPDGEKTTEEALYKVLLFSICGILLCMACLVSTTWAWFTLSLENKENTIQVATVTEAVTVTNTDKNKTIDPVDGVYQLENGRYSIHIQLSSNAAGSDAFHKPSAPVYALMSVTYPDAEDRVAYYCFPFISGAGEAEQILQIDCASAALRFSVTWVKPDGAIQPGNDTVIIGEKATVPVNSGEA